MRPTLVALLPAALLLAAAPLAAASAPQPVVPDARWFTVGALKVAALHDADLLIPNDGKTFGVDVGPAKVAELLKVAGAPTDTIRVSVNALLVTMPGHVVILDTGLGPMADGKVVASLATAGLSPAQVTDVLITHSHGDHVGGLVTGTGTSAFPNARIRMSAAEWAFLQGNAGAAKVVAAIAPQVATFAQDGEVVPGIRATTIAGHTPGHVAYELVSGSNRLFDIGDAAHSTIVSLAEPDWSMGFDSDQTAGKGSRRALLTKLAASHETIFSPHFPYPGIGTVEAHHGGFLWVPAPAGTFIAR